ncbi:MAG TPA: hypothetical protein VFD32_01335 [Dehalococcoidia bacterium]|nr:hypothetical protein [Dehalococcoidia bacterium]
MPLPAGVSQLVWAPAGERFAMVRDVGGGVTVSVADAADPDAGVTVFEAASAEPAKIRWSPDGRTLAIGAGPGLHIVSADGGGAPRQIADQVYAFVWTADSTMLTIVQWDGEAGHGESLTSVSAADGRAVDRILSVQTGVCPARLAWSPDGTRLAFSAGDFQNPVCGDPQRTAPGLWLWDQQAHALRQLEKLPVAAAPRWTTAGRIVAEREDAPFTRSLVVYAADGTAQTWATYQDNCRDAQGLGEGVEVAGDTLLYLDTSADLPQIMVLPLAGGDPTPLATAGRYTVLPLLSPDGGTVAYSSAGDGDFAGLAIMSTGGTPRAAVAAAGLSLRAQSWSADSSLLFVTAQDGPLQRCSFAAP